ncbi:hypothetical protein DRJ17_06665 [Candidatus Woesearchaeota archaeon]|nr:MAG: hypothetical protein DRJ17_06665 [Candidatus Woesearchaeota archaeon]
MKVRMSIILFLILLTAMLFIMPIKPTASEEELPVPREETLIIARPGFSRFDIFNPFIPNGLACPEAYDTIIGEYLWYINYATGEIIYWLITGWEYENNYTTLIFHVRKGVTWSDGKPFTAHDIAFTVNMIKENPKLYLHPWIDMWVDSVDVPDNYTCVIRLKMPNPRFHTTFKSWGLHIVPEHIWKDKDPLTFKNFPPIGTGPYKLYKVIPENNMFIFIRNDDYWAAKVFGPEYLPKPKYIIYRGLSSPDAEYLNWIRGDIDAFVPSDVLSVDAIKKALTYPHTALCPFLDPCPRGMWINTQRYPLNYTQVRWALSYLFNREKLAKFWPSVTLTMPAKYPWADWPGLRKYAFPEVFDKYKLEYNPEKAAKLLDELGIIDRDGDGIRETPNGTKMSFVVWGGDYLALEFAEEAKKIGIEIIIKPLTGTTWELMELGKIDMAIYELCTYTPFTNDPYFLLEIFHSKYAKMFPIGTRMQVGAWVRLVDPELDEIIDKLSVIPTDTPEGLELLKKGLELWMRDLPVVPIIETIYEVGWSTKYWTGWPTSDNLYAWPAIWWPEFLFVIFHLKPAHIEYIQVWFTQPVERFIGADGKEYGPFEPGDSARIPVPDADFLIKQGIASTKPVIVGIEELRETVFSLEEDINRLRTEYENVINSISKSIDTAIKLSSVAICIALIAIVLSIISLKKRR